MNRKLIIYVVLLVLLIGLIIVIDNSRPKPINWTPTYAVKDKIPLGLFVFEQESDTLFKGHNLKKFAITPYEYIDENYDYQESRYLIDGTFMAIDHHNEIDEESARELLYFADNGNTVFLSMQSFPQIIADTLNLHIEDHYFLQQDSIQLSLKKEETLKQKYWFNEGAGFAAFDSIDSLTVKVLGHQEIGDEKLVNFIQVPFGSGRILLHTQPAAFTNYHLLKGDHYKYAQGILSEIPDGNVHWFAKQFMTSEIQSPLRYWLSKPALKWALYFGLISFFVFAIFNAKRKQRIVPEIPPLKNTTVDFTKTIGNLYYQEGNHHTIIEKKIIYFLEYIRKEYLIDTYSLDNNFIEKLHMKIGKPVEDIEKTVSLIKKHRYQFQSTEADALEINKAIENLRL